MTRNGTWIDYLAFKVGQGFRYFFKQNIKKAYIIFERLFELYRKVLEAVTIFVKQKMLVNNASLTHNRKMF